MTILIITIPTAPDPKTLAWVLEVLGATQLDVSDETALTPHGRARLAAKHEPLTSAQREAALKIVAAGGDGKSIINPIAWQRE